MAAPHSSDGLDDLDGERPAQPFVAQVDGRLVTFRPATEVGWKDLLVALSHWPTFMHLFGPAKPRKVALVEHLPVWKMRALVRAWRIHHGLCPTDKDHLRLIALLTKPAYRSAIERDLHEVHGLDLAAEFQSRRWRRLLGFIDGLRRTSYLHEVMTQDDELAEAYLEREAQGEESSKPKRRMSEFSTEAELLSIVADRLGELIVTVGATKGGKRRRVEPVPRPDTAVHRVRTKRAQRKHRFTVARVYGYVDAAGNPTGRQPEGGKPPTS